MSDQHWKSNLYKEGYLDAQKDCAKVREACEQALHWFEAMQPGEWVEPNEIKRVLREALNK